MYVTPPIIIIPTTAPTIPYIMGIFEEDDDFEEDEDDSDLSFTFAL